MKKIGLILAAAASFVLTFAACGTKKETKTMEKNNPRVLVAYFSATGTTEGVAQMIAQATGGELLAITPTEEYTAADLDWTNPNSRSSRENADSTARPAIRKEKANLDGYDVVYLGYPNWWNDAPRIVNSFVEAYDLKGKKVVPFMTSGGSGIENSVAHLRRLYPDVDWQDGKLLNRPTKQEVEAFVAE